MYSYKSALKQILNDLKAFSESLEFNVREITLFETKIIPQYYESKVKSIVKSYWKNGDYEFKVNKGN